MAQEYYCEVMGQLFGPLDAADLRRMAKTGEITARDKVRKGDDGKWVDAGKVKGLFEAYHAVAEPKTMPAPTARDANKPTPPPEKSPHGSDLREADRVDHQPSGKPAPLVPEVLRSTEDDVASWIGPEPPPVQFGRPQPVVPQSMAVGMPVGQYSPGGLLSSTVQPMAVAVDPDYPCPFCGESIKLVAKKCKHCGEFLDPTLRAAQHAPAQPFAIAQPQTTTVNVSNVVQVGGPMIKRWNPLVAVILSFFIPGLGQIYKGQVISGIVWFFFVGIGYFLLILPGAILHLCCIAGASMGDPYR